MKKLLLFLLLTTLVFGATLTKPVSTADKIKQLEQENADLKKKLSFYYQELPDKGKSLEKLTPEQEYIKNFVEIYEVDIAYHDFYLSDKAVGVRFKIKNKGNQTLSRIEVLVKYKDKDGAIIYENILTPVYTSDWGSGDLAELKPNYIYQMKKDNYKVDENVPDEWAGAFDIEISKVEFKK